MKDVIVIGAGVIGGLLSRELARYKLDVCLVEKANDVAAGASKANSGIIHGGYDPEPGTLKAKMNMAGVPLLYEAADELNVTYVRNGSMICAFGEKEDKTVQELYDRGITNGVKGMEVLTGEQARALEPNLSEAITSVLRVPSAGIICPYGMTIAAVGNAMDNGVELKLNFEVCAIEKKDGVFTVTAKNGESVSARYIVNAAGAYSDKIAEMAGDKFFEIIPRAGEYHLLDKSQNGLVSHTIFQVPSEEGKGILVSPTAHGNILVGPTAIKVESPEHVETTEEGLAMAERLGKKSVPSLWVGSRITSFSGVRASVKSGDFIIEESRKVPGMIHLGAIDSPGLTSAVAIAKEAVKLLENAGLELVPNPDFNPRREDPRFFAKMSAEEKNAYIQEHPEFGRIVCRCETVSEGEMRLALRQNPPANDVDGIKRRTRGGMGRCQGGFCMPVVMRLISEERGIPMEEVTKNGKTSKFLDGTL